MRPRGRSIARFAAATGVIAALAACRTGGPGGAEDAVQRTSFRNEATLYETIEAIRGHHFDAPRLRADWGALRAEYAPRVRACRTPEDVCATINRMLQSLGPSHVTLLPPEPETAEPRDRNGRGGPPGDFGFRVRRGPAGVWVTRVPPDSAAARAGVAPGDRLTGAAADRAHGSGGVLGIAGHAEKFVFEKSGGRVRRVTLPCVANGIEWNEFGLMPRKGGDYFAELGDDGIGYVVFAPCTPSTIIAARRAIHAFTRRGMKALILDLRANPGGSGVMPEAIMGLLVTEPTPCLQVVSHGDASLRTAWPQPGAFTGPVAALIDAGTASSAEMLAADLQDHRRGTLFGVRTAGRCLGSRYLRLSTGYRLQTVFSNIVRIGGGEIEGRGVTPDVEARPDPRDLERGIDTALQAAHGYLEKQIRP